MQKANDTLDETVFIEGFKKHKERLLKFEEERKQKGISKELKEKIEGKIKAKLTEEKNENTEKQE